MRIEFLRFQNLNSLAGEWSVDFQDSAFGSGGIFAITGGTGAGKTTLLDALCLALFGRTPRLKTISTTTNEIMSRGTGECFAEVTFSTAKGCFRCHWSQRRARRKAEGRLQQPQHEIVDDSDGTVLETKLRQVALKVTKVTGLDFDRFTRSILLAQGGFAAFLQAGPDERAPILEEITGTGIYSEISRGVHERLRREAADLDKLQAQLDGLDLPNAEGEARLKSEQKALEGRLKRKNVERQQLSKALAWRESLAALEAELVGLAKEAEAQKAHEKEAQTDMGRLARAEKAQPLAAEHDRLKEIRHQMAEDQATQDSLAEQQKHLATELEAARHRATKAQAHLTETRRIQSEVADTLKAVRAFDIQRKAVVRQVGEQETLCRQHQKAVDQARAAEADARKALAKSRIALEKAQTYLETHPADAGLATAMAGIRRQCADHDDKRAALAAHETRINKAGQHVRTAAKTAAQASQAADTLGQAQTICHAQLRASEDRFKELLSDNDLADQRRRCEKLQDQLHHLKRALELTRRRETIANQKTALEVAQKKLATEARTAATDEAACRQEKTLREQAVADKNEALSLLRRVADLESERRHLRAGQPCPLCGSSDHPWAVATPPPPDDAQEALAGAQKALINTEKRLQKLIAKASRAASQLEETAVKLAELAETEVEISAALAAITLPDVAEAATPSAADLAAVMEGQRKALAANRETLATAEAVDKEIANRRADLEKARVALSAAERDLQKARFEAEAADLELKRLAVEGEILKKGVAISAQELLEELSAYGIASLADTGTRPLLTDLEERLRRYTDQQHATDKWQKTIAEQAHAAELEAQAGGQAATHLSQAQAHLETLVKQRKDLDQQRGELFGDKDPDQEEARFSEQVTQAERKNAAAEKAMIACQQAEIKARTRAQALAEQLTRHASSLAAAGPRFNAALGAAGFRDEADFCDARLSGAEMDTLSARKKALEQAAAALVARTKDREKALAKTRDEKLTTRSGAALTVEIEALDAERETLQTRAGALAEQLAQFAKTRARQAAVPTRREKQAAVCGRWERLHDLIGSADGKKFRVFAQGLTFEQVVAYANQELQKMSARYIMVRDPKRPLALLMADDYQGGVLRATDNLSGGESFLVSLALALGLARMASRKVRLDSLFLDEGFGTLDEETLEIALDTLGSLYQEGKLIGIISHVATLKERIPVQIKVISDTNGRSRLSGPGCRQHST